MYNSQLTNIIINNKNCTIMENFNRRMWENILERHFEFCDVEINEYHKGTKPCDYYGTFKVFSRIIEDVEYTYFFKIMYGKIKIMKL